MHMSRFSHPRMAHPLRQLQLNDIPSTRRPVFPQLGFFFAVLHHCVFSD
jgi:hypothetical protein